MSCQRDAIRGPIRGTVSRVYRSFRINGIDRNNRSPRPLLARIHGPFGRQGGGRKPCEGTRGSVLCRVGLGKQVKFQQISKENPELGHEPAPARVRGVGCKA